MVGSLPASTVANAATVVTSDRETVDAGALRVTVTAQPFALSAAYPDGTVVLAGGRLEVAGVSGPQRSVRATGLRRDGDAVLAEVQMTAGSPLTLRVAPAGDGIVSVTAADERAGRSTAISFAAVPGEVFTGFGERSNAVDFRGKDILDEVSDGPFRPEDRLFVKPTTPPWGAQDRDDDTYYPVPWMLSGRGYGVLIDGDQTSSFDLAKSDHARWSAEVRSATLAVRLFAGPTPARALGRFTAATGRQPRSDAPWVYGPWFQTGQANVIALDEEAAIIKTLREADVPVSAMETQMHYLPCGAQRGNEAYQRSRIAASHAAGLANLAYLNPHLCVSYGDVYSRASAAGVLQRDQLSRQAFTYPAFVGGSGPLGFTDEPIAQFDFTAPQTEAFYEKLVREVVDAGADGWMEDFGEYTPPFIASADGTPADALHNRYPRDYHCAVARIAARLGRPVTRHQRSGWTGAAKCASIVWGGDPTTVWGYDGLESAVRQALTIGMSGVARWGTDIGGYNSFGPAEQLSRELLNRWIEFGSVTATMRTKRSGIAVPSYNRPQVFDRESLPIWRRYTKLHTQLYPYLQAADAEYRRTGMPLMRHGLLTDPGDEQVVRADDQFGFGPDLLAAPVLTPGATERKLTLPAGSWVDWWRSVRYDAGGDGGFEPLAPRLLEGGRRVTLPAPVDELPLLVRAGSIIPMLSADVDTLAPYGGEQIVTATQRSRQLTLLAFPRGKRSAAFGADGERLRSYEGRRRWTLVIDGALRRRYDLRASLGTLNAPFRPCRVLLAGKPLPRASWRYDSASSVLTATIRATKTRVQVRPC